MSLKGAVVNTFVGGIEFITLKKFLELIPCQEVPIKLGGSNHMEYTAWNPFFVFFDDDLDSEPIATLFKTMLNFETGSLVDICRKEILVRCGSSRTEEKRNLIPMVEDAILPHAIEMGNPRYLVRLSARTWMPAQLDDFCLFYSSRGANIACLHPHRTQIINVTRT